MFIDCLLLLDLKTLNSHTTSSCELYLEYHFILVRPQEHFKAQNICNNTKGKTSVETENRLNKSKYIFKLFNFHAK